jgi:hypothetical protein
MKKKKLTQIEALRICRELWIWMARTGAAHKSSWPGWGKYGLMDADCPCCEYRTTHGARHCWHDCLIRWGNGGCWGGEYGDWGYAMSSLMRSEAALSIVRLAEEALRKRGVKVATYRLRRRRAK